MLIVFIKIHARAVVWCGGIGNITMPCLISGTSFWYSDQLNSIYTSFSYFCRLLLLLLLLLYVSGVTCRGYVLLSFYFSDSDKRVCQTHTHTHTHHNIRHKMHKYITQLNLTRDVVCVCTCSADRESEREMCENVPFWVLFSSINWNLLGNYNKYISCASHSAESTVFALFAHQ